MIYPSLEDVSQQYIFYLARPISLQSNNVLLTLIAGDAVKDIKHLNDSEVIDRCLEKLRMMFPDQVGVELCHPILKTLVISLRIFVEHLRYFSHLYLLTLLFFFVN